MKNIKFFTVLLVAVCFFLAVGTAMAKSTPKPFETARVRVIQAEVRKSRERSGNWPYEISRNREALRVARSERINLQGDVEVLKEKVEKVQKKVDKVEKSAKSADSKSNWSLGILAILALLALVALLLKGRQTAVPRRSLAPWPEPEPDPDPEAPAPEQGIEPDPPAPEPEDVEPDDKDRF